MKQRKLFAIFIMSAALAAGLFTSIRIDAAAFGSVGPYNTNTNTRIPLRPLANNVQRPVSNFVSKAKPATQRGAHGWQTNLMSQAANVKANKGKLTLTEVGPDFEIWSGSNVFGAHHSAGVTNQATLRRGQVVKMETGMNYWDGWKWARSEASFHPSAAGDAFVADRVQHNTRLAADINTDGAVTLTLPDGTGQLHSTPVAIGLYDPATGRAVLLASITNSTATLISSNRVLYPDAFRDNGICASILYTIKNGSFAQDVIITGHFDPADYGFPAESEIQVFTEVYDKIRPGEIDRKIPDQHRVNARRPDRVDHFLDFGKFVLGAGRAHVMTAASGGGTLDSAVTKEYRTIGGRTFIIESLEVGPMLDALKALPLCTQSGQAGLKSKFKDATVGYVSIPRARSNSAAGVAKGESEPTNIQLENLVDSNRVQVALGSREPSGLLIDYFATLNSLSQPTIFKSDVTYFISGPVYCNGPVTLEAACIKFPYYSGSSTPNFPHRTTSYISINNSITCNTSEYFPAVCTAADDESRGESLADYCTYEGCSSTIWPEWTGTIQGYYGSPCFLIQCPSATLTNIFFHYAAEAVRFDGTSAGSGTPYTLADAQIVSGLTAITLTGTLPAQSTNCCDQTSIGARSLELVASIFEWVGGVAYCDAQQQMGQPYNINIYNCLIVTNKNPVIINALVNANFYHCTFDQDQVISPGPLVSSTTPAYVATPSATFVNCIFANLPNQSSGLVTVSGNHNGFYNTFPAFGANNPPSGNYPFQAPAPGFGAYYLASDSTFHTAGATTLLPAILNDLSTRSTQPPDPITTPVTSQLTLIPHILRYTSGQPDLGYWYPALDYIYGTVFVGSTISRVGAPIVIEPGTAIAVSEPATDFGVTFGFVLFPGSTVVAHGTPNKPIIISTTDSVQEGQAGKYHTSFSFIPSWWYEDSYDDYFTLPTPSLSFRFCNFFFPETSWVLGAGFGAAGSIWNPMSLGCSMHWSLQDCLLRGGGILLDMPTPTIVVDFPAGAPAPGRVSWVNNVFDRVYLDIEPTEYGKENPDGLRYPVMDFYFEAYNNLFRGGWLTLEPAPSPDGDWTLHDNIFDKAPLSLIGFAPLPLDHDYNAYWLWGDTEQDPEWHPEWGQIKRLTVDPLQMTTAPHDVVFTSAPAYQNGTFGNFYLASSALTVNAGSRTPAEAHLFQYTTRTDNVKEGEETGPAKVNIGMHYVAAASGAPKSTLVSAVPDYVADADGNGLVDSTEFNLPATTYFTPKLKANNDFLQLPTNGRLTVDLNDYDSSGQPRTIVYPPSASITLDTPHGEINAGPLFRRVTYTPNAGFWGSDTFTYMIVNDYNQESSATCKVFVNQAGNTPPVAVNHNFPSYTPGALITISLLAGCTDANGDTLTVDSVTPPPYGFIVSGPNSAGQIQYFLDDFMVGPDIFQYVITDGKGGMSMATVTVTPNNGGNHAPIANSFFTTAQVNHDLNLHLPAYDPDDLNDPRGNNLYYGWSGPSHGSIVNVVGPHNGPNITYRPDPNFMGEDSFVYIASDGVLQSTNATVVIKVQPDNLAPFVVGADYTVFLQNPLTATPLTLPCWDMDGDYVTFTCTTPAHGTLTGSGPVVNYTPNNNTFEGDDYFDFTADDGKATATATIHVKIIRQQYIFLSGPPPGNIFKGNMTYIVTSPTTINDANTTVTFEGGAVVKFNGNPAGKMIFNGPINWQTSPLRPVIFTGWEDDSVGAIIPGSGGDPNGWLYGDTALELTGQAANDVKYVRIAHVNTAVNYHGSFGAPVTARHVQIVQCNQAFLMDRDPDQGTAHTPVRVRNCLLSQVYEQAFAGTLWDAQAEHLTVDACFTALLPDPASSTFTFLATNSVFSLVGAIELNNPSPLLNVDGDYNGFDSSTTQFGQSHNVTDSVPSPYAPPTSLATAQGWYYLRDGSPFIGTGTPDITPSLKADLTQMTCLAPQLLTNDIASSQTLSPVVPRTLPAQSSYPLGYHYPLVDYIVNGATVNNCTLNIDQGTILAFTSPGNLRSAPIYEWGLRLNPGGRLNVYGVPTNRVIFARLEAIQESPQSGYQQYGAPLITFKGVFLHPETTPVMVTPLPEAHVHYADFVTLAGNAVHIGPLTQEYPSTYDCVTNLELNGCLFQAGDLLYESGGPQNRTLTLRNNIFERSQIEIMDRQQPAGRGNQETFTAFNNLFYDSDVWLTDVSPAGASWSFTDNLFDNSTFHGDNKVAVNHNNGYVNTAPDLHLSPTTQSGSNPDLPSLVYDIGPLGRFYLPASATTLLGGGSRSAGAAGLYHFTSRASNAKEAGGTVNIGAAYLALVDTSAKLINASSVPMDFKVSATPVTIGPGNLDLNPNALMTITPNTYIYVWDDGATGPPKASVIIPGGSSYLGQIVWDGNTFTLRNSAADSNGDGVPDFIADRNGDGNEAGEMPWSTANGGSLAILSPIPNTTVSGTIQIKAFLPPASPANAQLTVLVDGQILDEAAAVDRPAESPGLIEVDTRSLEDGPHTFTLVMDDPESVAPYSSPGEIESPDVQLVTANSFRYPDWEGMAEGAISVQLKVPPTSETELWFFDDTYPKSYSIAPAAHVTVDSSSGSIDYAEFLSVLNISPGSGEIYPFTEQGSGASASATANPTTTKGADWSPGVGQWVTAYEDDGADYGPLPDAVNPAVRVKIADHFDWTAADTFLHDDQLLSWATCGGAETLLTAPQIPNGHVVGGSWVPYDVPGAGGAQTWPVRSTYRHRWLGTSIYDRDMALLKIYLTQPRARNFYGRGHGPDVGKNVRTFFGAKPDFWQTGRRYRFAFLDGCQTSRTSKLLMGFGASKYEMKNGKKLSELYGSMTGPLPISSYPSSGTKKQRPGLFLGYRTDTVIACWNASGQNDPATGCGLYTYDALSNWHMALVSYWQEVVNYDFITAAHEASQDTMCPDPIWPFPRRDDTQVTTDLDAKRKIPFRPDDCLVVFGYGNLKFNYYNAENSTWP